MPNQDFPKCEFDSKKLIVRLDFTIAADRAAISPLVEEVMQVARQMRCATGKDLAIEMVLRESLANAVVHGCRDDSSKRVQCSVACDETRGMLIVVRDPGPGFDPSSIPTPVVGQNIYSEHGRGIYLINQLMDEVSFERGGTEIHMRKF